MTEHLDAIEHEVREIARLIEDVQLRSMNQNEGKRIIELSSAANKLDDISQRLDAARRER